MGFQIEDGKGRGKVAAVNEQNQLLTASQSFSLQHVAAKRDGAAYQVIATGNLTGGTDVILYFKNNDSENHIAITYIRHQVLDVYGGSIFPSSDNYFRIAFGRTYSSGGSSVNPVNMNTSSGNLVVGDFYDSNPVLSGDAQEFDRWYTQTEGDMNTFSKDGSIIITNGNTMECSYVGDQSIGIVYVRVSFVTVPAEGSF